MTIILRKRKNGKETIIVRWRVVIKSYVDSNKILEKTENDSLLFSIFFKL